MIQTYLIIAAVIFLVGGLGYGKIITLQNNNKQLEAQVQVLNDSIQRIVDINQKNKIVMDRIAADKTKADKIIKLHQEQKQKDNKELSDIKNELAKQPAVQASPVILETIRKVQAHYK